MDVKSYIVTCRGCGGKSRLKVVSDRDILYVDHTPIIACRMRPDAKWGFECICGNDSRLAPEEKDDIHLLVQGAGHVIDRILKTINIKPETKFKMELN